uniref:Scribble n=1 Tax=Oopsacas minuta TaxID=111878 RepID=A0A2P1GIV5_9METZ|nr:scribble [Oopsacas minuta]
MSVFKACAGCAPVADQVDLRGKQLIFVPDYIYRQRRSLHELYLDYNQIKDLPPLLFQQLINLRVLTLSENDLIKIPPQIANMDRLVELDISKNGLIDLPDNIQHCNSLRILDVSFNPLVRTPDCVARVKSLTKCCLNDTNLERMPNEIGSLVNLQVLECRDNNLTELPASIGCLSKLAQFDLGGNEIDYLPPEIGQLSLLQELWLDSNNLPEMPQEISHLSRLECLDVSKNRLDALPDNINLLQNLADLHLTENCIQWLPLGIGHLKKLTLLKVDINRLHSLPDTIEHLVELREFVLSENALESTPAALYELPNLEVLYLDQNRITHIPSSFGKNPSLRILSLRNNELVDIPESVRLLTELKVLDLRNNKLKCLPASMTELDLSALWIGESQILPVMKLDIEPNQGANQGPTCTHHFLPQNLDISHLGLPTGDIFDHMEDSTESKGEPEVTFQPGLTSVGVPIERQKTPRYKDRGKIKDSAMRAVVATEKKQVKFESRVKETHYEYDTFEKRKRKFKLFKFGGKKGSKKGKVSKPSTLDEADSHIAVIKYAEVESGRQEVELKQTPDIPTTPDLLRIPKFTEEEIVVGREGFEELGFTFWGDSDYAKEGIFVKSIMPGSAAFRDGRLRQGDQILEVNKQSLENLCKREVAALLMNTKGSVRLRIHRMTPEDQEVRKVSVDEPVSPASSTELSSSDHDSDSDYPVEETLLVKSGKLGMSIVGGGTISSGPFGKGRPGIYISKIVPGGSADKTKLLKVGDRILEVNNQNLRKAAHITAVECFTKSGNEIKIIVRHVPPPPGLQEVSLVKKESESYGLVIRDDVAIPSTSTADTDLENMENQPSKGIYISSIQENSPASAPGHLKSGQRILEVNGKSLIGLQYKEAVTILSKCNTNMTLIICEGEYSTADDSDDDQSPGDTQDNSVQGQGQRQQWREMMTQKMTNQTQHMEDLIKRLQDLEENLKQEVPGVPIDSSLDPTN